MKIFGHYNDYNDYPKLESAAAFAATCQTEGADGLHLFNVWNDVIGISHEPDLGDKVLERIALLKPEAHQGKNKCYTFGKECEAGDQGSGRY